MQYNAKYQHCTMAGSQWINCEILKIESNHFHEDKYQIKYLDPNTTEWIEKWVDPKYIKKAK